MYHRNTLGAAALRAARSCRPGPTASRAGRTFADRFPVHRDTTAGDTTHTAVAAGNTKLKLGLAGGTEGRRDIATLVQFAADIGSLAPHLRQFVFAELLAGAGQFIPHVGVTGSLNRLNIQLGQPLQE